MAGSGCCLAVLGLFALQCFTVQEVLSAKVQAGNTADPGLSNANFVEHLFHSLDVAQVGFKLVSRMEDCVFACFRLVTCFSFNLEANPDIKDRIKCQLLASDIYNASDKFQPNATFHHFSIFSPCAQKPCKNGGNCTALYFKNDFNCECPEGRTGKTCTARFGCSFDQDMCGFVQSADDTFDWTRHSGGTPSVSTGPTADYSGTGYYMYIEASPRKRGDIAKLSKTISLTGGSTCLSFCYHMYGHTMGSLEVKVGGERVLKKVGDQGNRWICFDTHLSGNGNKELEFEAIVGSSYYSDVTIDEVNVYDC